MKNQGENNENRDSSVKSEEGHGPFWSDQELKDRRGYLQSTVVDVDLFRKSDIKLPKRADNGGLI